MKSAISATTSSTVFDRAALTARCMGNQALVGRVLSTFLTSFAKDHEDLSSALQIRSGGGLNATAPHELEAIRTLAHRMRGASGNIAAERLHARCGALERSAEQGDLSQTIEFARDLTKEWLEFRTAVTIPLSASKGAPCGS